MNAVALRLQDLPKTVAKFQRLRGLDSKTLKAAGFDSLLDELESECQALDTVREISINMIELREAFDLLLKILNERNDEPLPVAGLYCLMQPLGDKLDRAALALNEQVY